MSLKDRYTHIVEDRYGKHEELRMDRLVRDSVIILFLVTLLLVFWPFRSVPTGTRGVLTQFGAIKQIEPEGLVILPPWQSMQLFNIRAEAAEIDKAPGVTSDQQQVDTDLTVRYNIEPDKVAIVYEQYTHTGDLQSYVQTATQETFKAVTARYTAPELISKRAQVSRDIRELLQAKLDVYGAHVINIDMRNFEWSKTYGDAINQKVTQEQLRQVADNQLKTVESQQKQKVAIAEAEANAVKAKADGDAYATITAATAQSKGYLIQAQAQAEGLKVQNAALAQSKDVLELRRIEVQLKMAGNGWNGALPANIYGSAPIPFLQLPAPPQAH